jgi:hypothetical protein
LDEKNRLKILHGLRLVTNLKAQNPVDARFTIAVQAYQFCQAQNARKWQPIYP